MKTSKTHSRCIAPATGLDGGDSVPLGGILILAECIIANAPIDSVMGEWPASYRNLGEGRRLPNRRAVRLCCFRILGGAYAGRSVAAKVTS